MNPPKESEVPDVIQAVCSHLAYLQAIIRDRIGVEKFKQHQKIYLDLCALRDQRAEPPLPAIPETPTPRLPLSGRRQQSKTDTPRTDAVAVEVSLAATAELCEPSWREAVDADFARTLERENAQLSARIAELEARILETETPIALPDQCPEKLAAADTADWWCRMCHLRGLTKAQRDEHEKQQHPGEKYRRDLDDAHPSERRNRP